jgi:phage terminase small subunit
VKTVAQRKLNPKQQRFVEEYLIDLNATQAAIRAGYSPKTATAIASENLAKPNISAAIACAMAERSKRTGITQDRVLEELAKVAFIKLTDIVDDTGKIKADATDEDRACIESIKYKRTDTDTGYSEEREVKASPKLKALELIGRHLGMFESHSSKEQLKLNREKFEYEKEKAAGAFQEYEDMDGIEQDIYGGNEDE